MMLRKHQLCQFLSLHNEIGNATETRNRAWEEDCACQLHSRFHSNTPVHDSIQKTNVFLNDIFFFVNQAVIYNYADDNTLSFIHANIEVLKKVLEQESCILIDWFFKNFMQAYTYVRKYHISRM